MTEQSMWGTQGRDYGGDDAALGHAAKCMQRMQKRVCKAEEYVGRVADDLAMMGEQLVHTPAGERLGAGTRGTSLRDRAVSTIKMQAKQGVRSVDITRDASGSAVVRFDAGKEFPLTPQLADMLDLLRERGKSTNDGKVGWKTQTWLRREMGRRTGRSMRKGGVGTCVYRLREALGGVGISRFMVEGNRRQGYRLALWTEPRAETPAD